MVPLGAVGGATRVELGVSSMIVSAACFYHICFSANPASMHDLGKEQEHPITIVDHGWPAYACRSFSLYERKLPHHHAARLSTILIIGP